MKKLKNIHYGWFIVLAGAIIMGFSWSVTFNLPNLFVSEYAQELNLSRKAINFSFTLRAICQLLVSLSATYIFSRYKMLNIMKISTITLIVGIYLNSKISSSIGLYLCTILISVSNFFITIIPLSVILNNWFAKNIGMITGLSFMGSGIGTSILSPIIGNMLVKWSFRECYIFLALLGIILLIPIVFFVLKLYPEQIGLKPYGYDEDDKETNKNLSGESLSEAKNKGRFWLMLTIIMLFNFGITGLIHNIAPHMVNLGYDIQFASKIVSITALVLAFAKILTGIVFDKKGILIGTLASGTAVAIGLIAMILLGKNEIFLILIILGTGYGCSFGTVGSQNIAKHMFGNKDYGNIFSYIQIANSVGTIIAPLIIGILYDSSNSYVPAMMLCTIGVAIGLLITGLVIPNKRNEPY